MRQDTGITARRVIDETDRRDVVEVLGATYHREKQWVTEPESQIPPDDLVRDDVAWFIAAVQGRPAGTLRVLYDPSYLQYGAYGLKLLDPTLRIEEFLRCTRIAEVGRFAVQPQFRSRLMVAATLMRAATKETVTRGYTHLVTDVFEDDPHTPYGFHTRVLGFCPVATHEVGELHCRSRRITLLLDLNSAYDRLNRSGNWLYRYLTSGWDDSLHHRLMGDAPRGARRLPMTEGAREPVREYAELP